MQLPSNPANYKTRRGLFNAIIRAIECNPCRGRAMWIHNAIFKVQTEMPDLWPQVSRILDESAPCTLDDLIPIGHSVGC